MFAEYQQDKDKEIFRNEQHSRVLNCKPTYFQLFLAIYTVKISQ